MPEQDEDAPVETNRRGALAQFDVDRRTLIRDIVVVAVSSEIALVLCDLLFNYARPDGHRPLNRLFNITREDSLASWFASTQTFLIALTIWAIWATLCRDASRSRRRGWLALALFFSYMAVDDGAKIHERVGSVLGDVFEATSGDFPSYGWQLFVMPLFALAGVLVLFFLWHELPHRRSRLLVLAALTCLALALGMDFVEGLDEQHPWNLDAHLARALDFDAWTRTWFDEDGYATVVHFSKSIEEFLEMFANTLFWTVFLNRLMDGSREIRLRFGA